LRTINPAGCFSKTCKEISVAIGISSLSKNAGFNIYPNPASETITIETQVLDNQEINIQLINSLGQVVREELAIQHSTIYVNQLPKGIYHVKLINGEIVYYQKVSLIK